MKKSFGVCVYLVSALTLAAPTTGLSGSRTRKTRAFSSAPDLERGDLRTCSIGPSDIDCVIITRKGKEVACLAGLIEAGGALIGLLCEHGAQGYENLRDGFSEITWSKTKDAANVESFTAPGLHKFSSPNGFRDLVAYWGLTKVSAGYEVKATIFNLKTRSIVRAEVVGISYLGTDNIGYFPTPVWSKDGANASFAPPNGENRLHRCTLDVKLPQVD